MNLIKTSREIEILKQGGKILHQTLLRLKKKAIPGISGEKINSLAYHYLKSQKASPSFLNFDGFPANLCISINDEVVHGVPKKRIFKKGDLISLDLGVKFKNLFTDGAISFWCGEKKPIKSNKIVEVCKKCLDLGIKKAVEGNYINDISSAIQEHAKKNGFSVVRSLVGHGVGYAVHEKPAIPNYTTKNKGMRLKNGMCLAIEPMICAGSYEVYQKNDGWTFTTVDGELSCHFEHTVVVGEGVIT